MEKGLVGLGPLPLSVRFGLLDAPGGEVAEAGGEADGEAPDVAVVGWRQGLEGERADGCVAVVAAAGAAAGHEQTVRDEHMQVGIEVGDAAEALDRLHAGARGLVCPRRGFG